MWRVLIVVHQHLLLLLLLVVKATTIQVLGHHWQDPWGRWRGKSLNIMRVRVVLG